MADDRNVKTVLLVERAQFEREIQERITAGKTLRRKAAGLLISSDMDSLRSTVETWDEANRQLLSIRFSTDSLSTRYYVAGASMGYNPPPRRIRAFIDTKIQALNGLLTELMIYATEPVTETTGVEDQKARFANQTPIGSAVFVVHGHDGDAKYQVAEFLGRVTGSRPVILHEQPDAGLTIIEKFEAHAGEAGFAVVLLTPDDEGRQRGKTTLNPRARQNVVLELGFFIGRLGRGRVVAMYKDEVELPSDLSGVLYKKLSGNWQTELAKELRAAGVHVDITRFFG